MSSVGQRFAVALFGAAALFFVAPASFAQTGDQKPPEKPQAADGKDTQKTVDEFAEAEKVLGGAAGRPECLWVGRRVVSLLSRDDLDTAFRHLDLYDRFGCPAAHIQTTFRCLLRQGDIDSKAADTLHGRVHACWINPDVDLKGTAAVPSPTTNR